MTSAPAIGFEYRPSRWLRWLLATVAVLAALAILLSGLPSWSKLLLALLATVTTIRAVRRAARSDIAAIGLDGDGNWHLWMADRSDRPASLRSSRALGAFVLLRLQVAGESGRTVLLAPDNSDADIRRRLRMRLAASQSAPIGASRS